MGQAKKDTRPEIVAVNPFDASLVEFDYTEEQIKSLVKDAKEIDVTDLEAVKAGHKILVKIRTTLNEQGLVARRKIKVMSDDVMDRERDYLALAADTEFDLKKILDDDKQAKIMEARKELLPMKRDQLNLLEHCREVTDDEILAMDDKQWVAFYQDMMTADSTEKQRIKDEAEAEEKAEEARLQAIEDGKKQGIKEAEEKAAQKKKDNAEAEKAKKEKEAKAQEELEDNKKYKAFLDKNKFNPKTDKLFNVDGVVSIYRFVAKAKINIKK